MSSYGGWNQVKTVPLIAGQDLRGDLWEILQVENDSGVGKVIKATGVTNTIIGVLAEEPRSDVSTDGYTVPVALIAAGGILLMKAGASITAGQLIVADATAGRVAGVTGVGSLADDSMAIGIALESAADGDVFPVLAMPIAAPHTA
jgi:hypothetical protein